MFKSGEDNAEKTTLLGVTILANLQHGMLPCLPACLPKYIQELLKKWPQPSIARSCEQGTMEYM